MVKKIVVLHFLFFLSSYLSLSFAAPSNNTAFNIKIVEEHIIPGYTKLLKSSQILNQSTQSFCKIPDDASFIQVKENYLQTVKAWQSIQHIRFGPIEFLLRMHRYQLWPDKRGSIGKHVKKLLSKQDAKALEADTFAGGSIAIQGFGAMERILYQKNVQASDFSGGAKAIYQCNYLMRMSENFVRMSSGIVHDWSEGKEAHKIYIATAANGNAFYDATNEVSSTLLNNFYTELQVIVDQKLDRPLGENIEKARGKKAESWRSATSIENIQTNLLAVKALYKLGFMDRFSDKKLKQKIEKAFAAAFKSLDEIKVPLAEAVADAKYRPAVEAFRAKMSALKSVIGSELPEALHLSLGFNSLDGD